MSHAVVKLLGATTVRAVPTVNPKLVKKRYLTNLKVSAEAVIFMNLVPHVFHGESNDPIRLSRLCMPVSRHGSRFRDELSWLMRLTSPADHLTPDWWIPLSQPVSLPAPSPH